MSIEIPFFDLKTEQKRKIDNELPITMRDKSTNRIKGMLHPFHLDPITKKVYLPFSYAIKNHYTRYLPDREEIKAFPVFKMKLREHQSVICNELEFALNTKNCSIVAAYPGCGKTCMSIYMATKLRLKTLIVTHRVVLIKQWKECE